VVIVDESLGVDPYDVPGKIQQRGEVERAAEGIEMILGRRGEDVKLE
jgi:hypothetical protein